LDPQVITRLALPKTDSADVSILVPVDSSHIAPVEITVTAKFEGVSLSKTTSVIPGRSEIKFTAAEFPALNVANPRLWWPNGYGAQELYHLDLAVSDRGRPSDTKSLRFGIRHVTYEYSLFDSDGRLRRVEVDVAAGSARGERLIDNRHEFIKKAPGGWAASLTKAGETSPAVRPIEDPLQLPHLTLRVNGVRILARGGNWGMDDSRKRIDRARLEPYSKLQHAANLNIVRNWMATTTRTCSSTLRRIRPHDPQRLLGIDAGLPGRAAGSAALPAERRRHGAALSQSSFHRAVVRAKRRRPAAHPQRRSGRSHRATRRHAALHRQFEHGEPAGQRPV
jgi:hypothetical protein